MKLQFFLSLLQSVVVAWFTWNLLSWAGGHLLPLGWVNCLNRLT